MRSFVWCGILQGYVSVQLLSDPPVNRVSTVFCHCTTNHKSPAATLILTKKSKILTYIKCLFDFSKRIDKQSNLVLLKSLHSFSVYFDSN